jgi:iodotyrosine deiodinase
VMAARASDFLALMQSRRTIRFISSDPIPREILDRCIEAAATAPSGAHCQPWHFAVVETASIKAKIRAMVEVTSPLSHLPCLLCDIAARD